MPSLQNIAQDLHRAVREGVTLVVIRIQHDALEPWSMRMSAKAATSFGDLCNDAADGIASSKARRFTATAELNKDEVFVLQSEKDRSELEPLREIADRASSLHALPADDLDTRINIYAVAAGKKNRMLFVKRTDPRIGYQRGRFIATFGERLQLVEEPAFSFSPGFDMVLGKDWSIIVNQPAFERLFRETGLVDRHIAAWVSSISKSLAMEPANAKLLRETARSDSRLWRRLREIHHGGHLKNVTLDDVKKYAKGMNLDPNKIVRNDKLIFDPEDRFSFVHLLNEDLYRGALTDSVYEAQRKAGV